MQQQMKTYEHPVRAMKSAKWKEDMNSPTPRTDGPGIVIITSHPPVTRHPPRHLLCTFLSLYTPVSANGIHPHGYAAVRNYAKQYLLSRSVEGPEGKLLEGKSEELILVSI
ncbi:hypothetical protein CDAR_396311 [Caerostris darwini]|uniref:Uncharacterized protein n=1 Tax=Caerostris darwini TaxID=1538125 RepID=A0AAV4US61_9ARAC|nr:hypothetical protein CDAR_396311 [Caerostris darwini]